MRQTRPPGRGDCWILKITHAPSPKKVFKNRFCPKKGVAFLWEGVFAKKILRCGEDFDRIDGPRSACGTS